MTYRSFTIRDLQASVIAATATLVTILLNGPTPSAPEPQALRPAAIEALIGVEQAEAEAEWLLEQPDATGRLSFAPEYERLVWRVDTGDAGVILDAKTGEPLEFQFD
jgi:hypothetical protein